MSKWHERYKVHPAADVFDMMTDAELAALGEDIKANGLQCPIITWVHPDYIEPGDHGGKQWLIDGRNRLEAIERAGLDMDDILYRRHGNRVEVGDAAAIAVALNIRRRHLTKEQQAELIVAAVKAAEPVSRQLGEKLKKLREGRPSNRVKAAAVDIAKAHGIGKRTIERAIANYDQPTLHPNAPPKLRAKARRQRKRETLQHYHELLATLPRNVEGARRFYLHIVAIHVDDIAAEMERVVDGLQKLAEQPEAERLKAKARHG